MIKERGAATFLNDRIFTSNHVKIAPSILSANFAMLASEIEKVSSADMIHVDVMDGRFVPNITIGPPVVASLRRVISKPMVMDVHLMIEQPENYIEAFAEAGSDILTVHAEATDHLYRLLEGIKQKGMKAGVALNPATPACAIQHVLDLVDVVLVMTVEPGFGGQRFIESMVPKICDVKKMLARVGSPALIEVDGGIATATAPAVVKAGARILVAGTSVFGAADPREAVEELRQAGERALSIIL
ncbi:MAG TPA: ribulose-phosphate 3-epimerase [Firmicutes bacterium]|nr:ribulose-phosphate 3-epimerase [Bacillota bacterium]